MLTRAVHIEITHGMSTDSFILALQRFAARRGQPKKMVSDNGSNFRGAHNELRRSLHAWSTARIEKFTSVRGIEWQFGPVATSHWGGVWERMIRSVRKILYTISKGQVLTDETLCTFMCEVERILNNRPLTIVDDDSESLRPLTPAMLLLRREDYSECDGVLFSERLQHGWKRAQAMACSFWKRWKAEYLPTLQLRHRWQLKERPMQVGDLVIMRDEATARNSWPLARVIKTHAGTDGEVRQVTIRGVMGCKRVEIRRLCLLEGAS